MAAWRYKNFSSRIFHSLLCSLVRITKKNAVHENPCYTTMRSKMHLLHQSRKGSVEQEHN